MSLLSFYWAPEGAEIKACVKNIIFNQNYRWLVILFSSSQTLQTIIWLKEVLSEQQTVQALITIDGTIRLEIFLN